MEIEGDFLFLACTRPAMKFGVPLEGLIANFVMFYCGFMWVAHGYVLSIRGLVCILLFPVNHMAMRILISFDHNMFRIMRLWIETKGINVRGVSVLWAMPKHYSKAKAMASCLSS